MVFDQRAAKDKRFGDCGSLLDSGDIGAGFIASLRVSSVHDQTPFTVLRLPGSFEKLTIRPSGSGPSATVFCSLDVSSEIAFVSALNSCLLSCGMSLFVTLFAK